MNDILERWNISAENLTTLVDANPSLKGMLFGYVAEFQLAKRFPDAIKPDDHDRRTKCDLIVTYNGQKYHIEVKSLQSHTIKQLSDGTWQAKAQVDGSDKRPVQLIDGTITTVCLKSGEFDILAVNCFAFTGQWDFCFALNKNLPLSRLHSELLKSTVDVFWPPRPPFTTDAYALLDTLAPTHLN